MLKIKHGAKFAKNNKELVNSLFEGTETATGTYKRMSKGSTREVRFYNGSGELFAACVDNGLNQWFISCSNEGKRGGKVRYMNGLCSLDQQLLGLEDASITQENEAAKSCFEG